MATFSCSFASLNKVSLYSASFFSRFVNLQECGTVSIALPRIILTFHQQRDNHHQLCHPQVLQVCQLASYPDTPFGIAYVILEPIAGTKIPLQPKERFI